MDERNENKFYPMPLKMPKKSINVGSVRTSCESFSSSGFFSLCCWLISALLGISGFGHNLWTMNFNDWDRIRIFIIEIVMIDFSCDILFCSVVPLSCHKNIVWIMDHDSWHYPRSHSFWLRCKTSLFKVSGDFGKIVINLCHFPSIRKTKPIFP